MSNKQLTWTVASLLLIGLALRGVHYARNYPMWHDEAAPVLNVLSKSYAELWGPRYVNATEPPLTLWIAKATVAVLGDEPWALRLPSVLASCVGLALCVWWFRASLSPIGWIALAVMAAFSDRLLFHACEAKTYSFDFLISVIFLKLVTWDDAPIVGEVSESRWRTIRRQCLVAGLLSPLVFLCYPLVFMLAAFGVVQGCSIAWAWRNEAGEVKRSVPPLAVFGVVSAACAFVLVTVTLRGIQTASVMEIWAPEFPTYDRPALIPLQLVAKILDTFRYAQAPVGQILLLFTIVGAVALAKDGHGRLVVWFAVLFGMNAAAWLANKYPLGHYRVVAYLLPTIFLFSARGIETLALALADRRRLSLTCAVAMVAVCIGQTAYRLVGSWTRLDSAVPTRFVMENRQETEPVVADLWEQQYYLRRLGPLRQSDPPALDDAATSSFWYIGNTRDQGPEFLPDYPASGKWSLASRTEFRHFAVLRFQRVENRTPFLLVNAPR